MGKMQIEIQVFCGEVVNSSKYYQDREKLLKEIEEMEQKAGFVNQTTSKPDGTIDIRICDKNIAFRGTAKPLRRR